MMQNSLLEAPETKASNAATWPSDGGKPDRVDMKTQIGTYEILVGGFNHLEKY